MIKQSDILKAKLDNALRQMGKKQLKKPYAETWTPERPTTGYCYVVAEVIYRYFAPKGSKVYCMKIGDNETHWFLKDPEGKVIDWTSDQFDTLPNYELGKRSAFLTNHLSKRAKILAELLGLPVL